MTEPYRHHSALHAGSTTQLFYLSLILQTSAMSAWALPFISPQNWLYVVSRVSLWKYLCNFSSEDKGFSLCRILAVLIHISSRSWYASIGFLTENISRNSSVFSWYKAFNKLILAAIHLNMGYISLHIASHISVFAYNMLLLWRKFLPWCKKLI